MSHEDSQANHLPLAPDDASRRLAQRTLSEFDVHHVEATGADEGSSGMNLAELREMVRKCLNSFLNGVEVNANGIFSFRYESTLVNVFLTEIGTSIVTTLYAIADTGVPRSGALNKYVAEWGRANSFGALFINHNDDGTDDVNFHWTFFGMHLHPDDLKEAVITFALVADGVDDEVQSLFGGRRFVG